MHKAYYNEHDPKAATWLRELISRGLIAPGEVDERDIRDIKPAEIMGYTQCHFFAGIGTWSYALRRAGWTDDRPLWTGSCPCQPFSAAGRKRGTADERHLWPHWFHLISVCRPGVVFGEQVASKDGIAWLDLVSSDLEGKGYTPGAIVFPACGVGAPHKRDRLFFVADSDRERQHGLRLLVQSRQSFKAGFEAPRNSKARGVANAVSAGRTEGWTGTGLGQTSSLRGAGELGEPADSGCFSGESRDCGEKNVEAQSAGTANGRYQSTRRSSPVSGFWSDAEWVYCRDEKYRAVEPGTFPLAHGAPQRVGRLRGYGNGIVAQAAEEFIKTYREVINA